MAGKTIASLNIRLGMTTNGLEAGLSRAEKALNRSARKLSAMGDSLTKSISAPLAAIGGVGLKMATDLQSSFGKIENLVGVTGKTLDAFKSSVSTLSGEVGKSQQELSEALFVITSAGERGSAALEILESASKASVIGLGQTSEIARATTAVMQAYGKENISASRAIDVLTATVREGNLEASALAPVLGNVVGLAAKMGVSFEEVGASVATFTRLGVSAENAVTGLSGLLGGLLKPSEKGAKALESVGLSFSDLRKQIKDKGLAQTLINLTKSFEGNDEALSAVVPNIQALRTVLGTAGVQGEAYVQIANNISKATGLVDEAFSNASESAQNKFNRALEQLKNVAISLGNSLLPFATKIVDAFSKIVTSVNGLPQPVKNAGIAMLGFVASVGPALKVAGLFKANLAGLAGAAKLLVGGVTRATTAFAGLNQVMKLGIAGVAGAAIGVAVAALIKLTRRSDEAAGATRRLQDAQKNIAQETAMERAQLEALLKPLRDSSSSTAQRKAALDQLQSTYPKYFKNISAEQTNLTELDRIQKKLNESILKGVAARKKNEAVNDIYTEIIEKQLRINRLEKEGFDALTFVEKQRKDILGIERDLRKESGKDFALRKAIEDLKNEITSLQSEADATTQSFDKLFNTGGGRSGRRIGATSRADLDNDATTTVNIDTTPAENSLQRVTIQLQELGSLSAKLTLLPAEEALERGRNKLQELGDTFSSFRVQSQSLGEALAGMGDKIAGGLLKASDQFAAFRGRVQENLTQLAGIVESALEDTFSNIGAGIGDALSGAASGGQILASVLTPMLNMLEQVGKLAIATGVAIEGIKKAFSSLNPVIAIGAGVALIALSKFVKGRLANLGAPKLAKGGLAFGETAAIVGDNPNARVDPEVIAPLSNLKSMLGEVAMGGTTRLEGQFRIAGRDLILLLDDARQVHVRKGG